MNPLESRDIVDGRPFTNKRPRTSMTFILLVSAAVALTVITASLALEGHYFEQDRPDAQAAAAGTSDGLSDAPDEVARTLESQARASLGDNVDLGPAKFVALDTDWTPLEAADLSKMTSASELFGDESKHVWKVYVGDATDSGPASELCTSEMLSSCERIQGAVSGTLMSSVFIAKAMPELGPDKYTPVDDVGTLTEKDLANLRVERNARFISDSGAMTSVTETVFAPTSLDAAKMFSSPVEDLQRLATDPDLAWK